jgi:hypothetical protein
MLCIMVQKMDKYLIIVKLDTIKWSHKMFALTDYAFTLAENR